MKVFLYVSTLSCVVTWVIISVLLALWQPAFVKKEEGTVDMKKVLLLSSSSVVGQWILFAFFS